MKNKLEIVKDLVDNSVITFDEALILLDFYVDKTSVQEFKTTTDLYNKLQNNPYTVTSTSDLETK